MREPRTYVDVALDPRYNSAIPETDPDLEWVDREIQRCEDGPDYYGSLDPDRMAERNQHLRRLRRIRSRLLGEEPA